MCAKDLSRNQYESLQAINKEVCVSVSVSNMTFSRHHNADNAVLSNYNMLVSVPHVGTDNEILQFKNADFSSGNKEVEVTSCNFLLITGLLSQIALMKEYRSSSLIKK